jgi:hypothetical protein
MKYSSIFIGIITGTGSIKFFSHAFIPLNLIPANKTIRIVIIAREDVTFISFVGGFSSKGAWNPKADLGLIMDITLLKLAISNQPQLCPLNR